MNWTRRELHELQSWASRVLKLDVVPTGSSCTESLLRTLSQRSFVLSRSEQCAVDFLSVSNWSGPDDFTREGAPEVWSDVLESSVSRQIRALCHLMEQLAPEARLRFWNEINAQVPQYSGSAAWLESLSPLLHLIAPFPSPDSLPAERLQRQLWDCAVLPPVEGAAHVLAALADSSRSAGTRQAARQLRAAMPAWAALCPPLLDALGTSSAERDDLHETVEITIASPDVRPKLTNTRNFTDWEVAEALPTFLQWAAGNIKAMARWKLLSRMVNCRYIRWKFIGFVFLVYACLLLGLAILLPGSFEPYPGPVESIAALAIVFYLPVLGVVMLFLEVRADSRIRYRLRADLALIRNAENLYEELPCEAQQELNARLLELENALQTKRQPDRDLARQEVLSFIDRWSPE